MEYSLIEIFTSETAQHGGVPVYSAVLELVRRRRIAARLHVHRGIAGAYEGGEFSTVNLLDLSANLPVKVEVLLPAAHLSELLPALREIVTDGVVSVRPLDVRHHRAYRRLLPQDLRVSDVMTPDPVAVAPDTPGVEIARLLMTRTFRSVPVVAPDRHVLGVVSEEDLVRRAGLPVRPGLLARLGDPAEADAPELARLSHLVARDIMTSPAITVQAEALVRDAVRKMVGQQLRTLPVLDGSERLVGVVSRLDIIRAAGHWTHSVQQWNGVGLSTGAH